MGDQPTITWDAVAPDDDEYDYWTVCAFEGDPKDGIMSDVVAQVMSIDEEKDARLISAAPNLLAALQAFNVKPEQIVGAERDHLLLRISMLAVQQAAEAIAKATGAA